MPTERIRFEDDNQPEDNDSELYCVTPTVGPYKGQVVEVFKRGTSGVHGHLENDEEVYVFYHELKKPTRRIKA